MLMICQSDNYFDLQGLPDRETEPQAVRWATRSIGLLGPDWTKWHFTEGNCNFTACGRPVLLWEVDGSPQHAHRLDLVECKHCLRKMKAANSNSPPKTTE